MKKVFFCLLCLLYACLASCDSCDSSFFTSFKKEAVITKIYSCKTKIKDGGWFGSDEYIIEDDDMVVRTIDDSSILGVEKGAYPLCQPRLNVGDTVIVICRGWLTTTKNKDGSVSFKKSCRNTLGDNSILERKK